MFAGVDCFTYLCASIHNKQKNMRLEKREIIIEALKTAMKHVESESAIAEIMRFKTICATDFSPSYMEKFFNDNNIPKTAECCQEDDGLWFDWFETNPLTEEQKNLVKVRFFKNRSYLVIERMMIENGYKKNDDNKENIKLTCQNFYDMYVNGQYNELVEYYCNDFV